MNDEIVSLKASAVEMNSPHQNTGINRAQIGNSNRQCRFRISISLRSHLRLPRSEPDRGGMPHERSSFDWNAMVADRAARPMALDSPFAKHQSSESAIRNVLTAITQVKRGRYPSCPRAASWSGCALRREDRTGSSVDIEADQ